MTKPEQAAHIPPGFRRGQVQTVRLGTGPRPARVYLAGHPCVYEVRAGRTADGPVLLDLRVCPLEDGAPITADMLKSIPARRLAAAAINAGGLFDEDDHAPEQGGEAVDWSRWSEPERPEPRGPGGRPRVHGPEHYAAVADEARAARDADDSARKWIAKRWTVSETTADKWMREARRLGLLEPYRRPPVGGSAR